MPSVDGYPPVDGWMDILAGGSTDKQFLDIITV
jgi:hypothetical protein